MNDVSTQADAPATPVSVRRRVPGSPLQVTVGLCAALALALVLVTGQRLDAQAGQNTVAVADVESVIRKLAVQDLFQAELNKRQARIQADKQQREAEIEQLQARLKVAAPGTDQAREIENNIVLKTIQLEALLKFEQARLTRDTSLHFAKVYQDVIQSAGRIAAQNGYAVLMYKSPEPDLEKLAPKDLAQVFQNRKVLWHDGAVDLTQQIILQMNNDFNAQ
ncbi:MAG: hypothetical protein AAF797_13020 [Planctomycetota bacterium]